MPPSKNTGTGLQRAVQLALGCEPGLLLLTNTTGFATYSDEQTGKEWKVPYGLGGADGKGGPDLLGILAPHGRLIGFECKDGSGRATPSQLACHALWRRYGVIVEVVRSVADARALLAKAWLLDQRCAPLIAMLAQVADGRIPPVTFKADGDGSVHITVDGWNINAKPNVDDLDVAAGRLLEAYR